MTTARLLRQLLDALDAGEPCATATIAATSGSVPNSVGAKMLVGQGGTLLGGTVGGGRIEAEMLQRAGQAIAEGTSRLVEVSLTSGEAGGLGMVCGGAAKVFVEVHRPAPLLLLLGAGHVNRCVARMAQGLGYAVTAVDQRPEWASDANYPEARVVQARPEDALPTLGVGPQTFVVIATPGHAGDRAALVAAAATPARYIGMVASKRKVVETMRGLDAEVDIEALVPRLFTPMGLALGGKSPEAVALSVLAEIQRERLGGDGRSLRLPEEELLSYARKKP